MNISTAIFLFFLLLVFLGFFRIMKKNNAHDLYMVSLEALKIDPANTNLRHKTLELGRVYSNLTRNNKGVATVDEVALMNDINAACAGTHQNIQNKNSTHIQTSVADRLTSLLNLKEKDLINEEDFVQRKKEIMESI